VKYDSIEKSITSSFSNSSVTNDNKMQMLSLPVCTQKSHQWSTLNPTHSKSCMDQTHVQPWCNVAMCMWQDRPDGVVEAQLYLHRLDLSSFRSYTLVAENAVSTGAAEVQLVQACSAACRSLRRTHPLTPPTYLLTYYLLTNLVYWHHST